MAAFNVVRFRVKPGEEQTFIDAHRKAKPDWKGFKSANLIRTGENTFCIIGEWESMETLAAARSEMISLLDGFRGSLEDLGGSLGVTDPVSGDVVLRMAMRTPAAKKATGAKSAGKKTAGKKTPGKKTAGKKTAGKKTAGKKAATASKKRVPAVTKRPAATNPAARKR